MDFLDRLIAPIADGFQANLTLWFLPSKLSLHIPLSEVDGLELEHVLAAAPEGTQHVYFSPGLRAPYMAEGKHPERKRGRKKDVVAITAVLNDIDLFDPAHPEAHEAKNLPTSLDEAEPLILFSDRPDPNLIINSGNGIYTGHVFDRAVYFHTNQHRTLFQKFYKAYQKRSIDVAKERGWQMDSKPTVQEVFRLPGPPNGKTGKPTEILLFDDDRRADPADLGFDLPTEMFEPVFDASQQVAVPGDVSSYQDANDEELDEIKVQLANIPEHRPHYEAIQKVLVGESFAEPGERDNMLQKVCSTISAMPAARGKSAETLATILAPSLAVWAAEPDADKDLDDELEKAADKIARSQEDLEEKHQAKIERERPFFEALNRAVSRQTGRDPSFYYQNRAPSRDEQEEESGDEDDDDESEPPDLDIEEVQQYAIITHGSIYWVYDLHAEDYTPAIKGEGNLAAVCRDCWEGSEILQVTYINAKMKEVLKPLPKLRHEYSTHAHKVLGNLLLEKSYYDPSTHTFHEALANFAEHKPEWNDKVDFWLRQLAGESYEQLMAWLARFPRLDLNQSALYLDGISHAGKSMLARGLAKLWGATEPTDLSQIINEDFNNTLIQCPMTWIDEGLAITKRINVSQFIRNFLSLKGFSLNEKNKPRRPVEGCSRLVICANNDSVLSFGAEDVTVQDMDAIKDRFFHLQVQQGAADWLRGDGSKYTRMFVEEGAIARHVLYLSQTIEVDENSRFGPAGGETQMHRNMVMEGLTNGQIFEWLVRFADKPEVIESQMKMKHEPPRALIGNKQILINSGVIADCWKSYMDDARKPTTRQIARAVARLSHGTRRLGPRDRRIEYQQIDPPLILEWSRRNQIGQLDRIIENVERKIDPKTLIEDSDLDIEHFKKLKKYLH